jgi:protein SCO1/2
MSLYRLVPHIALLAAVMIAGEFSHSSAQPVDAVTGALKRAGITERLGEFIDAEATLVDESGAQVAVGDYFDGEKPVILNFVYHSCPMLCSMVLEATTKAVYDLDWTPGDEYRIVSISISDSDTPETATRQKAKYVEKLGKQGAGEGWHFLTGTADQVASVAASVGFEYEKDADSGEYGHAAAIMLLSPNGKVSRYFYGIDYAPFDVRAGLVEASEGVVGNVIDRLIMYCFMYDPAEGSYVPEAWLAMRLAGGLTVLALGTFLGIFWIRERRNATVIAREKEIDVA